MDNHTFKFNDQETAIIMESLVDTIQTSVRRLEDDTPDPVKVTLHTESVMRTAGLLRTIAQELAYGPEEVAGSVIVVKEGEEPPRRRR